MNLGFFNVAGNNVPWHGVSQILFYTLAVLGGISIILLWIFKRPIKQHYLKHHYVLGIFTKRTFWTLFGVISLIGMGVRSSVLVLSHFENLWESIPLHFCRLMLIFLAITVIFNKLHWIKYFGAFSIIGGIVAISSPDLNKNIGLDNFYYWDYILAHLYVLVLPAVIYVLADIKYTFKDTLVTFAVMLSLTTMMFFINWAIDSSNSVDLSWKSNYFYLGFDKYNSQSKLIPYILQWPFNYVTLTLSLTLYMTIYISIWCIQDKVYFAREESGWVFKWRKSKMWKKYKKSIHEFWLLLLKKSLKEKNRTNV